MKHHQLLIVLLLCLNTFSKSEGSFFGWGKKESSTEKVSTSTEKSPIFIEFSDETESKSDEIFLGIPASSSSTPPPSKLAPSSSPATPSTTTTQLPVVTSTLASSTSASPKKDDSPGFSFPLSPSANPNYSAKDTLKKLEVESPVKSSSSPSDLKNVNLQIKMREQNSHKGSQEQSPKSQTAAAGHLKRGKEVFGQVLLELNYNKFVVALTTLNKIQSKLFSAQEALTHLLGEECRPLWSYSELGSLHYSPSSPPCPVTPEGVERQLEELENLLDESKYYRHATDSLTSPVNGTLTSVHRKFEEILIVKATMVNNDLDSGNVPPPPNQDENRKIERITSEQINTDYLTYLQKHPPTSNEVETAESKSGSSEENDAETSGEEEEGQDDYTGNEKWSIEDLQEVSQVSTSTTTTKMTTTTTPQVSITKSLSVRENFSQIENSDLEAAQKISKFSELIDQVQGVPGWESNYCIFQLASLLKNSRVWSASVSLPESESGNETTTNNITSTYLRSKFPEVVQLLTWADKTKLNAQLLETSETLKISVNSSEKNQRNLQVLPDHPELENDADYWKFVPVLLGNYFAIYNIWGEVILGVEKINYDSGYRVTLESVRGRDILMSPPEFFWRASMVCTRESPNCPQDRSLLRLALANKEFPHLALSLDNQGNLATTNADHPARFFLTKAINTKYIDLKPKSS